MCLTQANASSQAENITSSQAAAHSPVVPDSHCSLALSMAVSTADLSAVCERQHQESAAAG